MNMKFQEHEYAWGYYVFMKKKTVFISAYPSSSTAGWMIVTEYSNRRNKRAIKRLISGGVCSLQRE